MLPLLQTEITTNHTTAGHEVVRIAFIGVAGIGSEGNHHGEQMRAVIKQIMAREPIHGLMIDLRQLDYSFGDWIGSCCLHPRLRTCPTCLIADGRTAECLRPLWKMSRLDSLVPIFGTLTEAEGYVNSALTASPFRKKKNGGQR